MILYNETIKNQGRKKRMEELELKREERIESLIYEIRRKTGDVR